MLGFAPLASTALADDGGAASYTLVVDSASFAISGQDAVVASGFTLTADDGSFTLAGQDAGFISAYTLTADFGSFTSTFQDVNINVAAIVQAGEFDLNGQTAAFTVSMAADAGSFTLTGQDADRRFVGRMSVTQGTWITAGQIGRASCRERV